LGIGDGDWGLGIGDWAQSPIPNPHFIYFQIFKIYYLLFIFFVRFLLIKYKKK